MRQANKCSALIFSIFQAVLLVISGIIIIVIIVQIYVINTIYTNKNMNIRLIWQFETLRSRECIPNCDSIVYFKFNRCFDG